MTIHTALVAEQSFPLRSLVDGFMKKAQTGTVTWDDVDEDTFALFAQFVYTGDYTPLSCIIVKDSQTASKVAKDSQTAPHNEPTEATIAKEPEVHVEPELAAYSEYWNGKNIKIKKDKKKSRQIEDHCEFHDLVYPPPTSFNMTEICKPRPNSYAAEDFTPVLLDHARLYVFAEKYDIKKLRTLALHKLHSTLCQYTLSRRATGIL